MRLHTKMNFLFLGITLLIILSTTLTFLMTRWQVLQARQKHVATNQRLVTSALEIISEAQTLFARDYSLWDDMAEAVARRDVAWMEREFFGPLEIYESSAAWVFSNNGEQLFSVQRDSQNPVPLPLTSGQLLLFSGSRDVRPFFQLHNGLLVRYRLAPILYHTRPERNTTPSGYLVIAKVWDREQMEKMERLVNARIEIVPHEKVVNIPTTTSNVVQPIENWDGSSPVALNFTFSDDSLQMLMRGFILQQVLIGILGVIGFLISIFVLENWVLRPISRLIQRLRHALKVHDKDDHFSSKSEYQILSHLINEYIHEIHRSRRFEQAVQSATDAIIMTTDDRKILYVNPAWEMLNGYTFEEVRGKNPNILKSGKTSERVYKQLWDHLNNHEPFVSEHVVNQRKDGTEYAARISVFPIVVDGRTEYYVGIAQDITERYQVEKMKGEFISLASHQLRTPLSAIRWFSELLLAGKGGELKAETLDMVKDIHTTALHMSSLVNDLLNISRLESGRLKVEYTDVSIDELLKAIHRELSSQISERKVEVQVRVDKDVPKIHIDQKLLREIVGNVFINAIKYSKVGGKVSVLVTTKSHKMVAIQVKDHGIGIPSSERKRLFEKFFRASNALRYEQEGTGLGLYLVKIVVETLGGSVAVESEENQGTTVTLNIPSKPLKLAEGEVSLTETTRW